MPGPLLALAKELQHAARTMLSASSAWHAACMSHSIGQTTIEGRVGRHRRALLAGSSVAALVLGGLLPVRAQREKPGAAMTAATQLGWVRNGEFAPILVAEAKGFFAEEGVAHRIIDGGPGKNPIPIVAVGQAQFGIATSGLYLLSARTARDPVDVVAVAALYQETPSAYLRIADRGDPDPTPHDLEGKTVGVQAGSEFFVSALARKNGLGEGKIKIVTVQANAEPLLVGRVDYFGGWVINQTFQIEQEAAKPDAPPNLRGKTWKALRYAQWGFPAYSDVIFTTNTVIKQNPELVRRYVRAVSRGMQYILDHPAEAVQIVAGFPGEIEDVAKLTWRWRTQNPLFTSADTHAHGLLWMNPATWDQMSQFMRDAGQIPSVVPAADVMTDQFVPASAGP